MVDVVHRTQGVGQGVGDAQTHVGEGHASGGGEGLGHDRHYLLQNAAMEKPNMDRFAYIVDYE